MRVLIVNHRPWKILYPCNIMFRLSFTWKLFLNSNVYYNQFYMISQVCSTLNPFYNKKTPWFTFIIITKNLEKNGKWSWNTISNISTWFQFFLPEQIVDDDHEISQLLSLLVQFFRIIYNLTLSWAAAARLSWP